MLIINHKPSNESLIKQITKIKSLPCKQKWNIPIKRKTQKAKANTNCSENARQKSKQLSHLEA